MFFRLDACLIVVVFLKNIESLTFINDRNADEGLQIITTKGTVQGRKAITYDGLQYWAYTGIPYAKPPLGNLRFRGPRPAVPWTGVLDATKESSNCVETFGRDSGYFTGGHEDCLYINVFTPQDPTVVKEYLPVMVWLYGGAFLEGNSSTKIYGPDYLLEQNVIVVTFNYRVGIFGFLSTGDAASPGNYGLKDQNLALRWVQENIKRFGGDKNLVTLFGQSAGAASAFYHLVSAKSQGLFHRIIANSGSTLCAFAYKNDAREIAFQIAGGLGISTKNSKELVTQMRKMDVNRLKGISRVILAMSVVTSAQRGFPFNPVIEPNHRDAFISDSTYTLMENGNINRVPVLTGITSLEAIFFIKIINRVKPLSIIFDLSPGSFPNPMMNIKTYQERREAGMTIKRHYFERESFYSSTEEEALNYISDDQFVRPIRKTIQLISKYVPVYFYLFNYNSDYGVKGFEDDIRGRAGVAHGEELSYIWKLERRSAPKGLDRLMVTRIGKLWANFARTGNPTPMTDDLFQNITWPKVTSSRTIPYLKIDADLAVGQNYREEHMQFWDRLYEQYGNKPYIVY